MSPDSAGCCVGAADAGFASILGASSARLASACLVSALVFETARSTTALSLPPRQNAKRIEHSRRRNATNLPEPGRLHSIKVAAGLIVASGSSRRCVRHRLLTTRALNPSRYFVRLFEHSPLSA